MGIFPVKIINQIVTKRKKIFPSAISCIKKRVAPTGPSKCLGFTPLEIPAAHSGDDGCSLFTEYGV
jgi:hypothetical protein